MNWILARAHCTEALNALLAIDQRKLSGRDTERMKKAVREISDLARDLPLPHQSAQTINPVWTCRA